MEEILKNFETENNQIYGKCYIRGWKLLTILNYERLQNK